jgi:AcrR family transcriptional regulator
MASSSSRAAPRRPAGARPSRDPGDKRQRLEAAARALFARGGYEGTSTAEIARRAGVSEGIVFFHFGSKQGLLGAVARGFGRDLAAAMTEGFDPEAPPDNRALVARCFAFARRHRALFAALKSARRPADADLAGSTIRDEVSAAVTAAMRAWQERGYLRPMDLPLVAGLAFGLVETALAECFLRRDGSEQGVFVDQCVGILDRVLFVHDDPKPVRRPPC